MAFNSIVIGTGFGGTIAAVQLAAKGESVLLLERGTFWRSPDPIGLNKGDPFGDWAKQNKMPVQYWPRPDHRKGMNDFAAALRNLHKFGLYQYSIFNQADVLTASGVGGGALIYSNVSIRSDKAARDRIGLNISDADYDAARLWMEGPPHNPADPTTERKNANRGWLNYVVTKIPMGKSMTAADFVSLALDPTTPPLKQEKGEPSLSADRSRLIPRAAKEVPKNRGIPMKGTPLELPLIEYDGYKNAGAVKNSDAVPAHPHCERQGRCILGFCPQARHT